MIKEFENVALTRSFPEFNLQAGDVGTVVDIAPGGRWYTLEFFNKDGDTIAVEFFERSDIREISGNEIAQTRALA